MACLGVLSDGELVVYSRQHQGGIHNVPSASMSVTQ